MISPLVDLRNILHKLSYSHLHHTAERAEAKLFDQQ